MTSLPTLRKRILRSFFVVVALYVVLGTLLLISVNLASRTTPKILHVNYDSIAAATKMKEGWNALRHPENYPEHSPAEWLKQFDDSLVFEEKNVTEPAEKEVAHAIRSDWDREKESVKGIPFSEFTQMRQHLSAIVAMNEKVMFAVARQNQKLGRDTLIGTLIYFAISLVLCVFFADGLSQRLSRPLKSIAEALQRRPGFNRKLKLPEPTNLEILILTTELMRMWDRLAESEKVNVAQLLQQKDKLETLLESAEDALLVLDPDGEVSHCNECLAKLVSLSKEDIQGHRWEDLPTTSENYIKLRSLLAEGMAESQQVELQWKGKDSYFSARSRKLSVDHYGRGGVLYLLHDITEKKQREKFRSEFIELLSHELKTPLQSLGTASELLSAQKSALPESVVPLIDTISEDIERIRAVAQEFVQITQSQSKIMKLKIDLVAINQVLPEWIKPFRVVGNDRKIKVVFEQEGSDVIWANLDLVKFPWVISNILSNAVRFSPPNGVVQVRLTDRNGSVEIQICDSGPGIPEAEQARVFEPFYQSPMLTSSGARGLFGIGLTIAKEVVEAHDGRIEYHRIEPHGSEFRILLPFPPVQYGDERKRETKSWTH